MEERVLVYESGCEWRQFLNLCSKGLTLVILLSKNLLVNSRSIFTLYASYFGSHSEIFKPMPWIYSFFKSITLLLHWFETHKSFIVCSLRYSITKKEVLRQREHEICIMKISNTWRGTFFSSKSNYISSNLHPETDALIIYVSD